MRIQPLENVEKLDMGRMKNAAVIIPKHVSFGDTPRSYTSEREEHQPQDGCDTLRTESKVSLRQQLLPGESEDAGITGGTRSLMRRLSGLNTVRKPVRPVTLTLQQQVSTICAKVA